MADLDKLKRKKKKSHYGLGRDRDGDMESSQPTTTMVILTKPPTEQPPSSAAADAPSSKQTTDPKVLTVLLKNSLKIDSDTSKGSTWPSGTRKHRDSSAENDRIPENSSETSSTTPVYQLQQKQSTQISTPAPPVEKITLEQKLAPPPEMMAPVKLVDEGLQWCDNAIEFLQDNNESFYVIGVLGLQGSGKSTVMSILAGQFSETRQLFKVQTEELKELGAHCTIGVDIYITSERLILLDTQPVLSASVMDRIIQYEKKTVGGPEYSSTENALQMQSLQIASFLMAVCHAVVLVQDWFCDSNLLRFIQAAEMLKPATPTSPDDFMEYYPHMVFVQNKCHPSDYAPEVHDDMEWTLSALFSRSQLKCHGYISNNDFAKKKDCLNLFLLPENDWSDADGFSGIPEYRGHEGFRELAHSLTHQVLAMPQSLLTRSPLSEKNWFHYAARIWEAIKKSNLFLEYSRLLP